MNSWTSRVVQMNRDKQILSEFSQKLSNKFAILRSLIQCKQLHFQVTGRQYDYNQFMKTTIFIITAISQQTQLTLYILSIINFMPDRFNRQNSLAVMPQISEVFISIYVELTRLGFKSFLQVWDMAMYFLFENRKFLLFSFSHIFSLLGIAFGYNPIRPFKVNGLDFSFWSHLQLALFHHVSNQRLYVIIYLTPILLFGDWTEWVGSMRVLRALGLEIGKVEFGQEAVIDDFFERR